ncbi:MAG: hypothetical protein RDU59_11890 [Thermodesulfobacteriota bacterium]|nr:hypothetical protein [Thermodesulfobacteriota bacterium]
MKKSRFPKGWDEKRVKRILAHYEKQTEEEAVAVAEDEAAYEDKTQTIIEIPVQLVSTVRALIAKHRALRHPKTRADNSG